MAAGQTTTGATDPADIAPAALRALLDKVYQERGLDFRDYRASTMTRRVARRLRARRVEDYAAYAAILDRDPAEYAKLIDDLTINVTEFFRDGAVFDLLSDRILPRLIAEAADRQRLGVWSAGCATGAEPYSIAVLLDELLGAEAEAWDVTILATDVDTTALARARVGQFTAREVANVDAGRRDRYFTAAGDGLTVRPALQRRVTFLEHDMLTPPPCADMDLVLCRNVLIYFTASLQLKVLTNLHAGLRQAGFMLLGRSEVARAEMMRRLTCVDAKAKLYRKVAP